VIAEVGVRTPLLEFFRRGEVARDVRLYAAQGALAPRALEQLALLAILTTDPDPEVARAAESTLRAIPGASLSGFLARPDVPPELVTFFGARGVEPASFADGGPVDDAPLVDLVPEDDGESADVSGGDAARVPALQRIAALAVPQRVALAMRGSREERAILVRDPNKLVAIGVLSSPKLTDTEVESIARMASVSDEVLRLIAATRAWTKSYAVVVALARNPKTPVAVSMNLLPRLAERDLKLLSTDRNVPDILRVTARRKVVMG